MKVYCSECKWFEEHTYCEQAKCVHPDNLILWDDWEKVNTTTSQKPYKINKKNDCSWFKRGCGRYICPTCGHRERYE